MKSHGFALAAGAALSLLASNAAFAARIITNTFTSASNVTLNGFAPDQAQSGNTATTWSINNSSNSDLTVGGGVLTMGRVSNQFMKAILPFNADNVVAPVTLSWDMNVNPGTDASFSFYGGFGNGTGDGTTFVDNATAAAFNVSNANLTGSSFTLNFSSGTTSATGGSTTITRATTSDPYVLHLSITRDTNNLVTGVVNGNTVGSFTNAAHIGGLWFKGDFMDVTAAAGGATLTYDNINVDAAAPEPGAACLLLCGGASALLVIRRRRSRPA